MGEFDWFAASSGHVAVGDADGPHVAGEFGPDAADVAPTDQMAGKVGLRLVDGEAGVGLDAVVLTSADRLARSFCPGAQVVAPGD